jgi:glycosyltransferase involved in cell wall biosynthesis
VHRALATANGLVDAGFDVTVLTCDRETFIRYTQADLTLEAEIDPAIEVVRVPFTWPLMDRDIRRWDRSRARDPLAWRERRPVLDVVDYPEVHYGPWRDALVDAAIRIHQRRPVDLSVATANPNVDIEAAHQLFLREGVPFVMDQRDAWTLNTFTGAVNEDERIRAQEAAYLRDATEAWFVNQPIRDWHAERYPGNDDRVVVVTNGYDPKLAPEPRLSPPVPDQPLTFAYLGTITSVMPMQEFLDGWDLARARDPEVARSNVDLWGYLGFYAGRSEGLASIIEKHPAAGVAYRGPVPRAEVRDRFADFDVMLLIVGPGRFITTGKVFDYMASGLPIVSVHTPELDASRVLADYPLWFPAGSVDPEDIAAALVRAAAAARSADEETRRRCVEHAAQYERSAILAPRLEHLRELVQARGGTP